MKTGRDKRGSLRLTGCVILLYAIPFQLGVLRASFGYDFIYGKTRSGDIINGNEAHLLWAGSTGVFYSSRSTNEEAAGAVVFQPWSGVKTLGISVGAGGD
jgi:hypothetical protein